MQLLAFWLLVVAGHSATAKPLDQVQLKLEEIRMSLGWLNKHVLVSFLH